jgi:hypothetical protein
MAAAAFCFSAESLIRQNNSRRPMTKGMAAFAG